MLWASANLFLYIQLFSRWFYCFCNKTRKFPQAGNWQAHGQLAQINITMFQFSSASVVSDSATLWTAAHQASLSITNSRSLLKLTSINSVTLATMCTRLQMWHSSQRQKQSRPGSIVSSASTFPSHRQRTPSPPLKA